MALYWMYILVPQCSPCHTVSYRLAVSWQWFQYFSSWIHITILIYQSAHCHRLLTLTLSIYLLPLDSLEIQGREVYNFLFSSVLKWIHRALYHKGIDYHIPSIGPYAIGSPFSLMLWRLELILEFAVAYFQFLFHRPFCVSLPHDPFQFLPCTSKPHNSYLCFSSLHSEFLLCFLYICTSKF